MQYKQGPAPENLLPADSSAGFCLTGEKSLIISSNTGEYSQDEFL
jgi:hypothetical protein